jgi:hypothetical protein
MNASIICIIPLICNIHSSRAFRTSRKGCLSIVRLPNIGTIWLLRSKLVFFISMYTMIWKECCQKYEQSKHQWYEKSSVTSCCQRFEQPKHNDMKRAQWLHIAENMSNQSTMIWKELSDFALIKIRAVEAQWFDKTSMTSHCQKYVQPKHNDMKRA